MSSIDVNNVLELQYLYFDPDSLSGDMRDRYEVVKSKYNINIKNKTKYNVEKQIMVNKLKKGVYDELSFAWKNGLIKSDNIIEKDGEYYKMCYGGKVSVASLKNYINNISNNKAKILELIRSKVDEDGWEKVYCLAKEDAPSGVGPVNIINALFFISKGMAPIYDKYVHKAIRALAMNITPDCVYIGENPDKDDVRRVLIMYKEYMLLLKKIFPDECEKKDEFISRELDRALWVYGHYNEK